MGKRGPAPVNLEKLLGWESQWWHSFRALRDGPLFSVRFQLEARRDTKRARLKSLKQMTSEEFHRDRLIDRSDPNLPRLPESERAVPLIETAEQDRQQQILWVRESLQKGRPRLTTRRKIWADLIAARTPQGLEQVCRRWARLADVREELWRSRRRLRFARFAARRRKKPFSPDPYRACSPQEVLLHATEFLSIKEDRRFPKSERKDAEHSRVDYLARGMAAIFVNRKPATGIEMLRNMKHGPDGPLWDRRVDHCTCWRCWMRMWPGGVP